MKVEITYAGLTFNVECYPGFPGILSGPPENCYPPEAGEIDILHDTVSVDDWDTVVEEFEGAYSRIRVFQSPLSRAAWAETLLRDIVRHEKHYDAIYALAMETAGDQAEADEDAYWDHKIDQARDDWDD